MTEFPDKQQHRTTPATRRLVLLVLALALMAWGVFYIVKLTAGYDGDTAVWVRIPRSATVGQAKDSIRAALGDSFGSVVIDLWNGDVKASHGAYRIEPGDRAWQVARRIGKGRQTPVRVTFNNVRTAGQLADILASRMDFSADDFMAECSRLEQAVGISSRELQAQFLPDTYEAYWTATPAELIGKIRSNYARFWNKDRIRQAYSLGLSPLQVSVLASIVEEESNRRSERPVIARLYLNRLGIGIPLQADPTVKFATGDFAARRITADMLAIESPYNTYRNTGLPPGIIRYPEARTLDQVLQAPKHDYIYMCARPDGSGYHDFTASYRQHLVNARAFRRAAYGNK